MLYLLLTKLARYLIHTPWNCVSCLKFPIRSKARMGLALNIFSSCFMDRQNLSRSLLARLLRGARSSVLEDASCTNNYSHLLFHFLMMPLSTVRMTANRRNYRQSNHMHAKLLTTQSHSSPIPAPTRGIRQL